MLVGDRCTILAVMLSAGNVLLDEGTAITRCHYRTPFNWLEKRFINQAIK
jgi:hypothetical protein